MRTLGRVAAALLVTVTATLIAAGTASAAPAAPTGADGCYVNVLSICKHK